MRDTADAGHQRAMSAPERGQADSHVAGAAGAAAAYPRVVALAVCWRAARRADGRRPRQRRRVLLQRVGLHGGRGARRARVARARGRRRQRRQRLQARRDDGVRAQKRARWACEGRARSAARRSRVRESRQGEQLGTRWQGGPACADGKSRRQGGAGERACCSQASVVAQLPAPRASASSAAAAPRGSAMPNGATGHSANSAPSLASTNSAKRCQPCGANAAARRRAAPARPMPLRGAQSLGWVRWQTRQRRTAAAWWRASWRKAISRDSPQHSMAYAPQSDRVRSAAEWSHAPPQGELASSVAGHAAARQCCAGAAGPPAGSAPAAVQLQLKALLG